MTVAGLCYLQDDDNSFYVFSYQYFVRALEPMHTACYKRVDDARFTSGRLYRYKRTFTGFVNMCRANARNSFEARCRRVAASRRVVYAHG